MSYQCRRGCSKVFPRSNSRAKHERINCKGGDLMNIPVVKEKELFYCKNAWCSRQFPSKFNRDRHKVKCKENTVPSCNICERVFKRNEHLTKHMGTHNIVYHKCEKCSKSFKIRSRFDNHVSQCDKSVIKIKFTPTYFECQNCATSYLRKDKFEKHVSVCNGRLLVESNFIPSMVTPAASSVKNLNDSIAEIETSFGMNNLPSSSMIDDPITSNGMTYDSSASAFVDNLEVSSVGDIETPIDFQRFDTVSDTSDDEDSVTVLDQTIVIPADDNEENPFGVVDNYIEVALCAINHLRLLKKRAKYSHQQMKKSKTYFKERKMTRCSCTGWLENLVSKMSMN